jgi:hypothetical protein
MAEIRTALLFVLGPQAGGMQASGATSGSNRPMQVPVHNLFEVV